MTAAFEAFFARPGCVLGEGAVIERLRRDSDFELDPFIVNAAFIYDESKKKAIAGIYRQYLDAGHRYDLPLLLSTPTWRASQERIADAGYAAYDVNGDNFRFLDQLRNSYGDYSRKVVICGLLSCKGDAYDQTQALTSEAAHEFHAWQANQLAKAGVDFLMAATLPALSEATGLARALAQTGKPYIISFVMRAQGTMLDGTPLKTAIGTIDSGVDPKPFAYMANCTHATNFRSALLHPSHSSAAVRERVVGLLANTAALSPEELDNAESLVEEAPDVFGRSLVGIRRELGTTVLGGCCGTDERHIESLAARLADIKN